MTLGVALALAAGLLTGVGTASASTASDAAGALASPTRATPAQAANPDPDPQATIRRADEIMSGHGTLGRSQGVPQPRADRRPGADATLTLRDLFRVRARLGFFDGLRAQTLLARPTQGRQDPAGDGYRAKSKRMCAPGLCVHYVRKGKDATDRTWARRTLRTLDRVWQFEIGRLGFKAPPSDGRKGGDARFDVYLTELGDRGLFGYCTPERRVKGERFQASGYCVLDNDFAREQYGAAPIVSLRVTAAHEFFHAIQFGYDFYEDPWFMESTATWIEERFADGANDNRRFLKYGPVRKPGIPLDRFSNASYAHYGNWAFWEYLTRRYSDHLVLRTWRRAGTRDGGPNQYSTQALQTVLARRGGLSAALAAYAAANLTPALSYAEGRHWPNARISKRRTVSKGHRQRQATFRLDHLSAQHVQFKSAPNLKGRRWRLHVRVNGPGWRTQPEARVTIRERDGDVSRRVVDLNGRGVGDLRVRFDARTVRSVVVTVVNGSTRYRCDRMTLYACGGEPRDNGKRFLVRARAVRAS